MLQRHKAVILVGCALALAAGAFLLLSPGSDGPQVRQTITPPDEGPTSAPAWVNTGQTPKPDYSPSTADAHNATVAESPSPPPPAPIRIREDTTVTLSFVHALTDSLLSGFHPLGRQGTPASTASVKALNIFFGREMRGLSTIGDDIGESRKAVLDYVFSPGMIRTLHDLYAPVLVADLTDTALHEERTYTVGEATQERTLSPQETATMLRLVASDAERTAAALRGVGNDPVIVEMAGKYLGAARAVERANLRLQAAVDGQDDPAEAGQRLKQSILQREQIKASIVTRMREHCPGCSEQELFYLAQWAYRRVLDEPEKHLPAFVAAADALDDLASRLRTRSTELE
ncbi:hypothetical protein GKC30_05515 [Pseudodesulfovibrio sp. F-1]|uniref:Uncharacterized protein n=1 Tax=Pseudodesulfovibrio alkaliphilus TaxID=2661613 RepID=A0A7K1KLX9_9BACT|nr:hypothetical protein [Pseudodesulfovibrio alkaliphilus]MUM77084.1 hypothetical protein [Pseudodesulfovibrio alkaliphilus]